MREKHMMTVTFVEPGGRQWRVSVSHRVGAGAVGEGQPLPAATVNVLRFESEGMDDRFLYSPPDDWTRPEQLPELFDRSESRL